MKNQISTGSVKFKYVLVLELKMMMDEGQMNIAISKYDIWCINLLSFAICPIFKSHIEKKSLTDITYTKTLKTTDVSIREKVN